MKKIISIFPALLIYAFVNAQDTRLNAYAGYVFDDGIDSYYSTTSYYNGTINGGFRWGLGVEYLIDNYYGIELMYLRQDTKAPMEYYDNGVKNKDFDLGVNWIMLNGGRHLKKDNLDLYGGFGFGVGIFSISNPTSGNSSSRTNFAWDLRIGANIFPAGKIGIKLQADVISAAQSAGGGFYFGTGGTGTAVVGYSTIYQFGLTSGLVFRFGGTGAK